MASLDFTHAPYGDLAIVAMRGCEEIAKQVDFYLKQWRGGAEGDSFVINANCPRFGTGEAKGVFKHSARGLDAYIICDCFNYSVTYNMYGKEVPMSPDDHYQDLKRIIAAMGGKARRVNVIMPMLYEGRQHRRTTRESMDCAMMLQELMAMGVTNFITFDAHDPRVNNAIPLGGFDNVQAAYQMIKALLRSIPDIKLDADHTMIVSPDEGGMGRCIYYSSVLGLDLGMFYKRRDYSRVVEGRNPIVAHEYLGESMEGKDVFIADDIIASGDSVLDIAYEMKRRKANRVFVYATYAIFTAGYEKIDKAYQDGVLDGIFGTNLTYISDETRAKPWFHEVDVSKYLAYIIAALNHNVSVATLLDPHEKINALLKKRGLR